MNGDALIQYRGSLIQKASKWKRHMLARLPQRRRQPCQAIGVNGDGLIRMAPATMHLAMTQVNAPPSFFDETPLVASSVWRGARGNARELQVPVRDIIMPLIWVRTWCIKHPHCMRSCAVAMHLRTTARRPGRAVGVCWGLAVLLGTARGCWGLLGTACDCSNSCVPPSIVKGRIANTQLFFVPSFPHGPSLSILLWIPQKGTPSLPIMVCAGDQRSTTYGCMIITLTTDSPFGDRMV